jgi:UrcA family protein
MSTNNARFNTKSFIGPAAIAACAVLCAPTRAADREVVIKQAVSTAGLDLNTRAGALALYDRLKYAAVTLCTRGNRVGLAPSDHPVACYEDALGNAVRAANQPQLSRVYLTTHTLKVAATYGISVPVQVADK